VIRQRLWVHERGFSLLVAVPTLEVVDSFVEIVPEEEQWWNIMTISKEVFLEALREAAEELGHAPTVEEYKSLDLSPPYNTIISRCGSWNAALEHFDVDKPTRRRYSDEDCLEALREATEMLGEEPTWNQYAELDISLDVINETDELNQLAAKL
jgi:hypothetical protein